MNKLREMLSEQSQEHTFKEFFDELYTNKECCTCIHCVCINPNVEYDSWNECDIYNKDCAMCETCLFYEPKERRI